MSQREHESNLSICSNLMLDDDDHRPQHRFLPGDFVGKVYPECADARAMHRNLTQEQIAVMMEALVCNACGKPCAGTCAG